jgi:hypothetical protein
VSACGRPLAGGPCCLGIHHRVACSHEVAWTPRRERVLLAVAASPTRLGVAVSEDDKDALRWLSGRAWIRLRSVNDRSWVCELTTAGLAEVQRLWGSP